MFHVNGTYRRRKKTIAQKLSYKRTLLEIIWIFYIQFEEHINGALLYFWTSVVTFVEHINGALLYFCTIHPRSSLTYFRNTLTALWLHDTIVVRVPITSWRNDCDVVHFIRGTHLRRSWLHGAIIASSSSQCQ